MAHMGGGDQRVCVLVTLSGPHWGQHKRCVCLGFFFGGGDMGVFDEV